MKNISSAHQRLKSLKIIGNSKDNSREIEMNRFETWFANKFHSYHISKPLKPTVAAGLFALAVALIGLVGVLLSGGFQVITTLIQARNDERKPAHNQEAGRGGDVIVGPGAYKAGDGGSGGKGGDLIIRAGDGGFTNNK